MDDKKFVIKSLNKVSVYLTSENGEETKIVYDNIDQHNESLIEDDADSNSLRNNVIEHID